MKKITKREDFCDGFYLIEDKPDTLMGVGSECKWITKITNLNKETIKKLQDLAYDLDRDIAYVDKYIYCLETKGVSCNWRKVNNTKKEYTSITYLLKFFDIYSINENDIEKYVMVDSL